MGDSHYCFILWKIISDWSEASLLRNAPLRGVWFDPNVFRKIYNMNKKQLYKAAEKYASSVFPGGGFVDYNCIQVDVVCQCGGKCLDVKWQEAYHLYRNNPPETDLLLDDTPPVPAQKYTVEVRPLPKPKKR